MTLLSNSVALSRSKIFFPLCACAYNFLLIYHLLDPTKQRVWLHSITFPSRNSQVLVLLFSNLLESCFVLFFPFGVSLFFLLSNLQNCPSQTYICISILSHKPVLRARGHFQFNIATSIHTQRRTIRITPLPNHSIAQSSSLDYYHHSSSSHAEFQLSLIPFLPSSCNHDIMYISYNSIIKVH